VLAREITNLAGSWGTNVAGVVLAAIGRVEVAQGGAAVAVGGDGQGVDVVNEGTVGRFEAGEVYSDVDTVAAGGRGNCDAAGDGRAGGIVDWVIASGSCSVCAKETHHLQLVLGKLAT